MAPTPETDWFTPDRLAPLLPRAGLDVAQVEAWASGVIAEIDDLDALIDALGVDAGSSAVALLAAIAAVAEGTPGRRAASVLAGLEGVEGPPWLSACGTARPVQARWVQSAEADVVAVEWCHDDGTTHTMLVEVVDGSMVAVRFGGGDMFELLEAESGPDVLSIVDLDLGEARRRLEAAVASGPVRSDDETWVNAALARCRFRQLEVGSVPEFEPPATAFAGVVADPETARFSADVLQSALRGVWSPDDDRADDDAIVAELATRVRPPAVFDADEREARALCHLEWADWIGAVIGVVRAGSGATCTPTDMVVYVNRCPEISTTIPAAEAEEVAACFAAAMRDWERVGVSDAERLTERGRRVLPRVLLAVAVREAAGSVADN
ncbi:MAG: hypothetical protein ACR2QE_08285 [Acidimicrobiales bacterium]